MIMGLVLVEGFAFYSFQLIASLANEQNNPEYELSNFPINGGFFPTAQHGCTLIFCPLDHTDPIHHPNQGSSIQSNPS